MANLCEGCLQTEMYCSVNACHVKNRIKNRCPCSSCIVKIKCSEYCNNFKDYCLLLYNTVEHDLTLCLMANRSIKMFSRKRNDT